MTVRRASDTIDRRLICDELSHLPAGALVGLAVGDAVDAVDAAKLQTAAQ